MSKSWWLIGIAGILCFASGCDNKTVSKQPGLDLSDSEAASPMPTVSVDSNSADSEVAKPLSAQDFFPNPLVSQSSSLKPVPVPNLIPPTTSIERVPQVDTGRPDPFATLGYTPTVVKAQPSPAAVVLPPAPKPVTVAAQPPLPAPTVMPLPPLLPAPSTNLAPLPSVSVPAPPTPPQSSAETIEISGVIQVAGKTNVIIKDPNEHTSRYVGVGDRLANGTVLVKRVEMGLEPLVILEQGGREIVRSIGSSSALVGAL